MSRPSAALVPPSLVLLASLCALSCSDAPQRSARLQAVTLGIAESPALDALAPLLERSDVPDDEADVLIADGDHHDPGTLADDARVRAFLQAGKPVLFLDVSPEHVTRDLVPLLHGVGQGDARAVLARKASDPSGGRQYFVYAFPGGRDPAPTESELDAFRTGAQSYFAGAAEPPALPAGFDPPPGLLYVVYNLTLPPGQYEFTSTKDGSDTSNGTQWTSVVPNYRFTLFFENANAVTGDRQWVVAESFAEASPLNSAKFSNQLMITKTGSGFVSCDIGWFQVELDSGAYPVNQATFDTQQSQPQNANEVTSVDSRLSFGVSFLTPTGATSRFGYQSNDSTALTQWKVDNTGNGAVGRWEYKNQDPWIWNQPSKWDDLFAFGHGVDLAGSFLVPNDLAKDQLQADTKIAWTTSSVLSTQEPFTVTTDVTYLNVWAPAFKGIQSQDVTVPLGNTWLIDLAAVVPVPISAITFSPNPVDARDVPSVTGTVVFASPAPLDTIVYLTSNSDNATVPPFVTVPQGETSTSFQVDVNANGLTPEEPSTVATIAAFDALPAQAQLTITRRR